jgi:hypothetical protein
MGRVWSKKGRCLSTPIIFIWNPSLVLAEDIGWPREMTQNGARIVYYQPQIDQWTDYRTLNARMAISVTPAGGKPTPGVVSIEARTDADKETRTVVISDIKLTDTRFPSTDAAGDAKLGELVRNGFGFGELAEEHEVFEATGLGLCEPARTWQTPLLACWRKAVDAEAAHSGIASSLPSSTRDWEASATGTLPGSPSAA